MLCCGNSRSQWEPLTDAIENFADPYVFGRGESLLTNLPKSGPCVVVTSFGMPSMVDNYPEVLAKECKERNPQCTTIYYSQDHNDFSSAPFDHRLDMRDKDGYPELLALIRQHASQLAWKKRTTWSGFLVRFFIT